MATIREVTAHFDSARQREFRRFLVASALLHLGAFALLTAVPALPTVRPSGAIAVNLVAAPRAVRAVPAPRAAPKPKPKPPKPAPVVLPTEPTAPKPKPAPREEELPEPEPVAEEDYGDVMAQLREELGFTQGRPSALQQSYKRERQGWYLFYSSLAAAEQALQAGEAWALSVQTAARQIVSECLIN